MLAGAFRLAGDGGLFAPVVCLAVGAMMAVIAVTGNWPPRKRG